MTTRHGPALALAIALMLGACTSGSDTTTTSNASSTVTTTDLTPMIQDILVGKAEAFTPQQPGTYAPDPDLEPSTPMRVTFHVSSEGWRNWIGAAKFSDAGWVSVSITTVSNLVSDGCRDHSWADPPVGPTGNDLATALANLAPFRVTSPRRTCPSTATAGST